MWNEVTISHLFLDSIGSQVGNMDLPKVATRCAEAIVTSLALQSGEAQKLVLFEGIDVATKQAGVENPTHSHSPNMSDEIWDEDGWRYKV